MQTPIVVPLDGSSKDEHALAAAPALARLANTGMQFVRVVSAPPARLVAHAQIMGVEEEELTGRREAEEALEAIAARERSTTGLEISCVVLDGSDVAEQLIRHVEDVSATAVVMATRAASAPGRALRGSVADAVMRGAPRPVVLVPPHLAHAEGARMEITRVLVPLDGSGLASRALDFLVGLPGAADLELILIESVLPGRNEQEAEKRLEAAAAEARSRGVRSVEIQFSESANPVRAILDGVRDNLADAIAMSTRGASGLRRLALGSVAEGVVRESEVPLLLLTPAALGGTAQD